MAAYVISPLAREDIKSIFKYISRDNRSAARSVRIRMTEKFRIVGHNPEFGEACDEIRPGLRFTLVGNYVIYYRSEANKVLIVRVLHGTRDRLP